MKLDVAYFLPQIQSWVESLAGTSLGLLIKQTYAWWGVGHILSLVALGGSTILMNLRLLDVGLKEESPEEIYRNLRVCQNVGVGGIIVTGIMLGTANAERLYYSAAFVVKGVALIAGIILTYGASRPVAAANGNVTLGARVWFAIGGAVFLLALAIFAIQNVINAGVFLIIAAAAMIVLSVTRGWLWLVCLAVLVALIIGEFVYSRSIDVRFGFAFAVWIGGIALYQLFRSNRTDGAPLTGLIAYATILVWVMAAAAGRWIAFE